MYALDFREHEKLSQRQNLWQQVESLAKTNPEWPKLVGDSNRGVNMSNLQNDFEQIPDGELTYDKLEQESREV